MSWFASILSCKLKPSMWPPVPYLSRFSVFVNTLLRKQQALFATSSILRSTQIQTPHRNPARRAFVGDGLSTKNIFCRRHFKIFLGPTRATHCAQRVPALAFDSPIIHTNGKRHMNFFMRRAFVGDGGIEPPTSTMSM